MEVVQLSSAQEFLEVSAHFRAGDPYMTNVIGSVAVGVVEGRRYDSCHWWVVKEGQEVVGLAVRTAPYNLLLPPMPAAATRALAASIADTFPKLPGVSGPPEQAQQCAEALQPTSVEVSQREIVYVLRDFSPPPLLGTPRRCAAADEGRLVEWMRDFHTDAGIPQHNPRAGVDRMLSVGWLLEVEGEPVSMCGHAPAVGDRGQAVGRIGPVFTPREHRRRGYAAVITSKVVQELSTACDHIMLYADADNPTSNSVYQRLGFVEHGRMCQMQFTYA